MSEPITPHWQGDDIKLYHGDSLAVLRTLPDASVDAVVTDPPYGLEFMGREWDGSDGFRRSLNAADVGRDSIFGRTSRTSPEYRAGSLFQEWSQAWATECLRVLKPGGHLLAFGGTRTWHRLAAGIEDAGFEIRDTITWMYGSGFPKSLDVSKAIDKAAGATREVVSTRWHAGNNAVPGNSADAGLTADRWRDERNGGHVVPITAAATDDARRWQGWGTALKPASEPIVVARKPLAGTVAQTVLAHGTGALNIDGCRVGTDVMPVGKSTGEVVSGNGSMAGPNTGREVDRYVTGRWPANVVLSHAEADGVDLCGDGCVPGCPVAELDRQSGVSAGVRSVRVQPGGVIGNGSTHGRFVASEENVGGYDDSGGASRFFPTFRYEAKAPGSERPRIGTEPAAGGSCNRCALCGRTDISGNRCTCPEPQWIPRGGEVVAHPTVKPLELMRWLVRLVTPPGGTVLDPFAGSGTTAEACLIEGFGCVTVEIEADHLPLIVKRLSKGVQLSLGFGEL